MPARRTGYSSFIDYYPRPRDPKTRIKMPQIDKRPLRFQLRTLLRKDVLHGQQPWWMVVHRRGISRPKVGENPLEARAVPASLVPGYLTERILYATLVNKFHFIPGVDFLFQSSVDGGRLEMGGLVADFLFPILRVVINPLGPQHYQFRNMAKDEEQVAILAEMGYQAYLIDEEVIYDEYELDEFLRRVFTGLASGGGDPGAFPSNATSSTEIEELDVDELYASILELEGTLNGIFG